MRKKRPRQNDKTRERDAGEGASSAVRHGSLAKRIIKGRRGRNKKVVVVRACVCLVVGGSSGTTRFDSDHLYDPQSMSRAKKGERERGRREDSIELSTSLSRKIPRCRASARVDGGKKRRIRRDRERRSREWVSNPSRPSLTLSVGRRCERASVSLWRLFFVLIRYLFPRDGGRRKERYLFGNGRTAFYGNRRRTEREVDGDKMLALHNPRKYRMAHGISAKLESGDYKE